MAWAVDLGVQITDVGRRLYIGSFCPAMTSLSRYLEEAAFSISISSSVFIFLWLFSRCIMDIVTVILRIEGRKICFIARKLILVRNESRHVHPSSNYGT